jgi:hypothetical protein
MGTFVANIQLRVSGSSDRALETARGLLLDHAARTVYEPSSDALHSDRTTRIVASAPEWVTVFDEDAEVQDLRSLEALAAAVSLPPVSAAVSVLVSDSDDAILSLFRNGDSLGRIRVRRGKTVRLTAAWRTVFPQLPATLPAPGAFAEEPIETIGSLLGWKSEFVLARLSDRTDLPPAPAVELSFKLRAEHQFLSFAQGPPLLDSKQRERRAIEGVGRRLRDLSATIINEGGAFTGLRVVIPFDTWTEVIEVEGIRLTIGAGRATVRQPVRVVERNDSRALVAEFPELQLGGYPSWTDADEAWKLRKAQTALDDTCIWSGVEGAAKRIGTGMLEMFLLPLEYPKGGELLQYEVAVVERPPWLPPDS